MQNDGRGRVKLSPKEQMVLKLICSEGLPYKEIAQRLGVSKNTIAAQTSDMLAVLRLSSRHVLMLWGWQRPQAMNGEWVEARLHGPQCDCGGPICSLIYDAEAA